MFLNKLNIIFGKMAVFDAAQLYASEKTPLIAIVGKDYGSGSSRDWAAKGPFLLVINYTYACLFMRVDFNVK